MPVLKVGDKIRVKATGEIGTIVRFYENKVVLDVEPAVAGGSRHRFFENCEVTYLPKDNSIAFEDIQKGDRIRTSKHSHVTGISSTKEAVAYELKMIGREYYWVTVEGSQIVGNKKIDKIELLERSPHYEIEQLPVGTVIAVQGVTWFTLVREGINMWKKVGGSGVITLTETAEDIYNGYLEFNGNWKVIYSPEKS